MSTSSAAFAAILDDLVRTTDLPAPAAEPPAPSAPPAASESPKGTSLSLSAAASDNNVPLAATFAAPPARLRGRGDLTLVVGLGGDALAAARTLAASAGRDGEALVIVDRRDALAARADGVREEHPVVGAFSLPGVDAVAGLATELAGIAPDQVWVAVDASRKTQDTAHWVGAVDAVLAVDGIAATGAALTASPDEVRGLGLPVLWLDAPPEPAPGA
ncbi:hypothetical protein [Leifsonia sp. NPDC080035]|uniref:Uncharacterized protein n=1 Tax=Leifsonia sp. NPDC080035 TaxID=3143936 RepID=A0AAU7GFC3_9MICO